MIPFFPCLSRILFHMLEVNAISRQIKDMQGRIDALRGYL